METMTQAHVTIENGVPEDCRGSLKANSRNRRQVTVMSAEAWRDTLQNLGVYVPWQERRVNLMVEGLELEQTTGARIVFAAGLVLEVTGECNPCKRMEDVALGLDAALRPNWRGGVTTRVVESGSIAIGEQVRIER